MTAAAAPSETVGEKPACLLDPPCCATAKSYVVLCIQPERWPVTWFQVVRSIFDANPCWHSVICRQTREGQHTFLQAAGKALDREEDADFFDALDSDIDDKDTKKYIKSTV